MKKVICLLLICLLALPSCALAELKRGDRGDDEAQLQRLLFETGFLFEEPDGVFGKNTEDAVKWFQQYASLEPTGIAGEYELDALYDCWLQLMDEPAPDGGEAQPPSEDEFEAQYTDEEAFTRFCHCYEADDGNRYVELCRRHAALNDDLSLSATEKWTNELNALYDEWIAASPEENRAAIASGRAFFLLWIAQQETAFRLQGVDDVEHRIAALLRSQCASICHALSFGA